MFDVLVHATPLGMTPRAGECFFHGRIPAKLVFDMVYNPLETLLLRKAKSQGAECISGLEMFIEQAVAPVRDLHRRQRPARRDGTGRARSPHANARPAKRQAPKLRRRPLIRVRSLSASIGSHL